MSMLETIQVFPQQFNYKPKIEYELSLPKVDSYVICGMGGSHLAADIVRDYLPAVNIKIYSDYGLPLNNDKNKVLFIFSSYSGNTEEVIEGYRQAQEKNLPRAVIAVGGVLLDLARRDHIPYIQLPNTGIQPRSALGYSFLALLKMLHQDDVIAQSATLATTIRLDELKNIGKDLADEIVGFVPIIYTSQRNQGIAYNWKIKFNETGKIPAFYNVIPELNHNEMTGFDIKETTKYLADRFYILMLVDEQDYVQNKKRFEVLFQMYHERRLPVKTIILNGFSRLEKIFNSLLLADFTAFFIASHYGLESEQVPMVEEFKHRIAR